MEPSDTPAPAPQDKWAPYAAVLSEKRRDYYLRAFRRIDSGKRLGLSWNWAALLFTFSWLRSRRMHGYSWAYFFVSTPVLFFLSWLTKADRCAAEWVQTVVPGVLQGLFVASCVLPPLLANRIYYGFVQRQIASVQCLEAERETREQRIRGNLRTSASLGSWMLMAGIVVLTLWVVQAHQGYEMRARVSEVVLAGSAYRTAATEFFMEKGRFPANIEEIGGYRGPHRCVKEVTLEKDGSIHIVAGFKPVEGKTVILTPTVKGNAIYSWTCRPGDMPAKYLPGNCR